MNFIQNAIAGMTGLLEGIWAVGPSTNLDGMPAAAAPSAPVSFIGLVVGAGVMLHLMRRVTR